jgi:plastocyanin
MAFVALVFAFAGCGSTNVQITIGAEGFEPPVLKVPAGKTFDLQVTNTTKAVQEVRVQGRPPLRAAPGITSTRQVEALEPGEYKVTLLDAPFEATLRAEE